MTTLILGEQVCFKFPKMEQDLFHNLSFKIRAGSSYRIAGPSGSGKSTLAYIIAQLLYPTAGSIEWTHDLKAATAPIRMVFQDPFSSINPLWSIQQWLEDMHPSHGWQYHLSRIMEHLSLDSSLLQEKPLELSGGECQRFCLASALIAKPKILILDEAFSMMESEMQANCLELVQKIQLETNSAILKIKHFTNENMDSYVGSLSWQEL